MNVEYVYMILQGIDKLFEHQKQMDSISRRQNELLKKQLQAMEERGSSGVEIDDIANIKLLR